LAKCSLQANYERAEESKKICMYNLENQKKKLVEVNVQIVKVEKILKGNRLLSEDEYRKQIMLRKYLKLKAYRLTGLIEELKGTLKAAEEDLIKIKKNYNV
jgi:hypothetical protein